MIKECINDDNQKIFVGATPQPLSPCNTLLQYSDFGESIPKIFLLTRFLFKCM